MNQNSIGGRWKPMIERAATRQGRAATSAATTLRMRIGRFFEALLAHGRRHTTGMDSIPDPGAAAAAREEADRRADQNLDSDYGSSPRLGRDNLAATAVADPSPGLVGPLAAALARLGRGAGERFRRHPGISLIAAAAAGFVAAHWASPSRRAP